MIPPVGPVLLDTNVLVHLLRGNAVGQRIDSDHALRGRSDRPAISIVTVGELRALARKRGWSDSRRRKLDELVSELVVVNLNQGAILEKYAELEQFCEKGIKPAHPIGQNDLWIAATAIALGAHLLTADRDFDHLAPRFIRLVRIDPATGATLS